MTADGSAGWTRPLLANCLAGLVTAALLLPSAPAAVAAPITSNFDLGGAVDRPGSYALADLQALPALTTAVTYGTGTGQVSAAFTGPTLWSVLSGAGLTPVPDARNSTLRNVVVATGSDGYAVAFSGGELDPRFGGSRNPALIAYARDGQPLGLDGFARTVAPGDAAGGRYVSNLAGIDVVQAPSNPPQGGSSSSSFTLSGLVQRPTLYDAVSLAALPALTESVTYTSGGRPVSAIFTGVSLWSLLVSAGLVTDPGVKNSELRQYVLATGSDGYEAAFSLGELDPRFGGSANANLVAFAQDGQPLGADGFARLVVPGDLAGGRYVSNLVSLQVLDTTRVTTVPEPGSLALLLSGLFGLAMLSRRREGPA
ncbi:PEP-CTERM sorting domain-containing protein [Roseomonas nepalensis]|uniref:PEP-CTERM sorting domain-containing protein n=1 Tax=Muricoccus nepalensis TaxID=1854500 RepID=A0A502FJE4_9PROT|nr:molybdopterin-dependent oxidoreductase [Roseomonas nepalensis]TPG49296.1 PEP-CTERM sorting domain-containing protein [Roseomonas nepalensis]